MSSQKSLAAQIAPLFLVLLLDGMGLSLLFPVLNSIIVDTHSHFLPMSTTLGTRNFLYGLTISIFMLCWFFGATILGDLSDYIGRKKSLMICLIGAFLGYLLSAVAIHMQSFILLLAGRIVAGFTAGSQPIAQAAIVDISPEEQKTKNLGLILLSVSLGFVLGPIIGGVLSNSHWVHWFNFATPMYFASIVSFINAILLWYLFDETFTIDKKMKLSFHRAIRLFLSAFEHPKVRWLSLVLLVVVFGWSSFFSFIPMYLSEIFGFTPLKISLALADMGIGFSLGCGYLVNYLSRYFPAKYIAAVLFGLTGLFTLIMILAQNEIVNWILLAFVGAAISSGWTATLTLFSNQVGEEEQGWVMGITGSIMALCFGVTTFFTGYLTKFSVLLPLWFAVGGLLVSAAMLYTLRRKL